MRSISEDIYQLALRVNYALFYYDYLSVLRLTLPEKLNNNEVGYFQYILNTVIQNQQAK